MQVIKKRDQLWHKWFGHLNHKGLRSLVEKEMVSGLPAISQEEVKIVCEVCMKGKQNRESIPKKKKRMKGKTWTAIGLQ